MKLDRRAVLAAPALLGRVDKLTTGGFTNSPRRGSTLIFGMEIGVDPRTADGR